MDNDPQLASREMYQALDHRALGRRKMQNSPFKLSATPVYNDRAGPLIGEDTRDVMESLLGLSHAEVRQGYEDGTFWPTALERFDYMDEMLR